MLIRSTLFAAAVMASGIASAQEATIRYRAYELASVGGRQAVADRVHKAVHRACRNGVWFSTEHRCRKSLSSDMLQKIGNADVAARYSGQPVQLASRN